MRPDGRPSGPGRPDQARVFFALWPDRETRAALHQAAQEGARRFGGRPMQLQTLHLTLAFIGSVPLEKLGALRAAGAAVRVACPVSLRLDRLGFWSHNRILWAGSREATPGLPELAAALGSELESRGYPAGQHGGRPFSPHVTLVRNVPGQRPQLPELMPIHWTCEHFVLVRSRLSDRGADYEILESWSL